jgi:hypothetical protein
MPTASQVQAEKRGLKMRRWLDFTENRDRYETQSVERQYQMQART